LKPMDTDKMFGEPTDAEVAQFLKEWDEGGKDRLSQEAKDALSSVGFRRSLQLSMENTRLREQVDAVKWRLEGVINDASYYPQLYIVPHQMKRLREALAAITQQKEGKDAK
jgi:hypothetical protein